MPEIDEALSFIEKHRKALSDVVKTTFMSIENNLLRLESHLKENKDNKITQSQIIIFWRALKEKYEPAVEVEELDF